MAMGIMPIVPQLICHGALYCNVYRPLVPVTFAPPSPACLPRCRQQCGDLIEEELNIAGGLNPMGRPKLIDNGSSPHANAIFAVDQRADLVHWQHLLTALTCRKHGQQ